MKCLFLQVFLKELLRIDYRAPIKLTKESNIFRKTCQQAVNVLNCQVLNLPIPQEPNSDCPPSQGIWLHKHYVFIETCGENTSHSSVRSTGICVPIYPGCSWSTAGTVYPWQPPLTHHSTLPKSSAFPQAVQVAPHKRNWGCP